MLGFNNPELVNACSGFVIHMYKNPRWELNVHEFGQRIYSDLFEGGYLIMYVRDADEIFR